MFRSVLLRSGCFGRHPGASIFVLAYLPFIWHVDSVISRSQRFLDRPSDAGGGHFTAPRKNARKFQRIDGVIFLRRKCRNNSEGFKTPCNFYLLLVEAANRIRRGCAGDASRAALSVSIKNQFCGSIEGGSQQLRVKSVD